MPHKVGNGAILGIVSEDGVPAQKRITLMDRSNLSIIKRSQSDEYGAYAFTGLNPDTDDYIIFTVDDDGVERKAAIMYDYVKPIPAHQGGFYWANWLRLSNAKEPLCSFIANTTSSSANGAGLNFGVGRYHAVFNGTALALNKESITPAAKNMATIGLENASLARYALNHKAFMTESPATSISAEWVLDASTVTTSAMILLMKSQPTYDGATGDFDETNGYLLFAIGFNKSDNTISVIRSNGLPQTNKYVSPLNNGINVITYSLPVDLIDTVLHISASIKYGDVCTLYINGVLAQSASLSGTNLKAFEGSDSQYLYAVLGGASFSAGSPTSNKTTFDNSIFAFYSDTMSSGEALDHYESLFIDKIPEVTGYLKSVISDFPLCLFRLSDEDDSAVAVDALRPHNKIGNGSALIKYNKTGLEYKSGGSIVVGGAGTYFNGGALLGVSQFSFPNSGKFASVEFIAKPSVADISNYQVIFSNRLGSLTLFEVRITAARKFSVAWNESATPIVTSFNTIISTEIISHYAISIDKELGFAYLFAQGVLVESFAINKTAFDNALSKTIDTEKLHIGGVVDNLSSVSLPYIGYLSEVAAYPYALTERVVKSHYDARLDI